MPKRHRQLRVKDLAKVLPWWLERDHNHIIMMILLSDDEVWQQWMIFPNREKHFQPSNYKLGVAAYTKGRILS